MIEGEEPDHHIADNCLTQRKIMLKKMVPIQYAPRREDYDSKHA